ncbi:MAG: zinc-dependent metalloprotease [Saprospiraceae bacterium]|nr:zinc-dependent metalloprotease [Saprospiraceae bacterium]MCB9323730.1 zinc-dependent metalloprotease [Lewinellaceae bacterium]
MRVFCFFLLSLLFNTAFFAQPIYQTIAVKTKNMTAHEGFFNFYSDPKDDVIWLEIDKLDQEFIYVNSLKAAIGSNDIGLDRNQLGDTRVVKFQRFGSKVMMVEPNYRYRAISDNPDEQKAVEEAFAQSVLWGFKIEAEEEGKVLIDLSEFLLNDAHGVADRLAGSNQGTYVLSKDRSALFMENTKNFPKNSEFEALLTFTGKKPGNWIRSVTPSADAVTVRQHHSFVELPDDQYKPRIYDPRSGYYPLAFKDYATPISQPLEKRFIFRHRLEKKNPLAKISEPVEPIIYYLDRGAPEPIRSALMEGASWWNEAFEAAGFKNAFRVELLPEGADPMDVRYNVINWVHRTTRGWSYGSSVSDPRTGEIIKGHVLLGSLRVRQDFLIAQGLVDAYANGEKPDPRLEELALARLRQLAAHEVGHTLGLTHNFAASTNDRSSVMDYPHPYITLKNGKVDFSEAYDTGIGEWDKRMIIFGYSSFMPNQDEAAALKKIIEENLQQKLAFITDQDARPQGGAHPSAHLWDNGTDAVQELERIMELRKHGIDHFSEKNIPSGAPMATLENVFAPLYLMHRYQVEAVAKVIGGNYYTYAVRGDGQLVTQIPSKETQLAAVKALCKTLDPSFLEIPEHVLNLLPPPPLGYDRDRESFKTYSDPAFDPLAAAESSAANTIDFLIHPQRLARLINQKQQNTSYLSVNDLLDEVFKATIPTENAYSMMTGKVFLNRLLEVASENNVSPEVLGALYAKINELGAIAKEKLKGNSLSAEMRAHYAYIQQQFSLFTSNPEAFKPVKSPSMPDGSPIGCDGIH